MASATCDLGQGELRCGLSRRSSRSRRQPAQHRHPVRAAGEFRAAREGDPEILRPVSAGGPCDSDDGASPALDVLPLLR